jgi:hypothetical protein
MHFDAVQLVFDFQLLSFEFVNERKIGERSSLFFEEYEFDFFVLGLKRFGPRILTHRRNPPDRCSQQQKCSAEFGAFSSAGDKVLNSLDLGSPCARENRPSQLHFFPESAAEPPEYRPAPLFRPQMGV